MNYLDRQKTALKKMMTVIFCWLGMSSFAQNEAVIFSQKGGFYPDSFELSLDCFYSNHEIHYTLDGSTPTAGDLLYKAPLTLSEELYSPANLYQETVSPPNFIFIPDTIQRAIVIRAAVFDSNGVQISEVNTQTYLIERQLVNGQWSMANGHQSMANGLPLLSIVIDPASLLDADTGIFVPGNKWNPDNPELTGNYYQKGRGWERLANVEFYEPADNSGINQQCGLRTHGNRARRYPAKGMKIYAREEYGKKRFKHEFFEDSPLKSFKHLIIKPFSTLWPYAGIQDYICNQLALSIGLEAAHSRPVQVYLNGEFWGIYFLQEKMDERYLEDHYDIEPDNCNIIGSWGGVVESGDHHSFLSMMDWLEDADLSLDANYEHIQSIVDIPDFIDYMILETFICNKDWPNNNMRCWQVDDSPWRWMFYDGDYTFSDRDFDVFENACYIGNETWPSSLQASLLFRRLLENNHFKQQYNDRVMELCGNEFQYRNTHSILQEVTQTLQPFIVSQSNRFGYPESLSAWLWANNYIDSYLQNRTETYLEELENFAPAQPHAYASNTNQFIVYPNPVQNTFYIMMADGRSRQVNLSITDITGRVLYHYEGWIPACEPIVIENHWTSGIYFIHNGEYTVKVVK